MNTTVGSVLMATVACVLVALSVWAAVPLHGRRSGSRLRGLSGPVGTATLRRPARVRRWPPVVVAAGLSVPAAGLSFGSQAAVLCAVGVIVAGTAALLGARHRSRRRRWARRQAVAQACSVLAAQARIGQVPGAALRSAAEDCEILRRAVTTAELGGDVVECWREQAAEPGAAGLADLARAWQLAVSTGAELAGVLERVAEALNDDQSLNLVITSEAAAPRATGKIMAALPVVGIGLGYLMGGDPLRFLLSSAPGWACLLVGSVCACLGVLWMERIADRASADTG